MVDADAEGEGVAQARVAYCREVRLDLGGGDLEELLLALVRLRSVILVGNVVVGVDGGVIVGSDRAVRDEIEGRQPGLPPR